MPTPDYILDLRRSYGSGRLFLPGVSAVVVRGDLGGPGQQHILLTRRTDTGRWALPAGIVEPDEQPAVTIARELVEETRVEVEVERLALVSTEPDLTYPNGDVCQFLSLTFRCRYVAGEAQVGDEESTDVAWFATHDLPVDLSQIQLRKIACSLTEDSACVFDR